MRPLGTSLLCLSLWAAPLAAQEAPEATPVDDGGVFVVDPLPGEDLGNIAESGIVTLEAIEDHAGHLDHANHACELGADGHCLDAACECLHHLPLADNGAVPGEELMFYSLAASSGAADNGLVRRDDPQPNFRGLEAAALANTPAALNPAAFDASRSLLQEQQLRSTLPGADLKFAAPTATGKEPGLFARMLVRNSAPAPVTTADQDYAKRLAAIDTLRDQALASGDSALLQQADRLEQDLKGPAPRGLRWFRR